MVTSRPKDLYERLPLLLQEDEAENNSKDIDEKIIVITGKLLDKNCHSINKNKVLMVNFFD